MDNAMYFANSGGRNYMMRSEKRPGYSNKPSRRKKPKKRWVYKLLTMLLLLLCYPVGLVLLWRKVIRWSGFNKLLISIVALMLCFVWMSVALLYDFGNPTVKRCKTPCWFSWTRRTSSPNSWAKSWMGRWKRAAKTGMR